MSATTVQLYNTITRKLEPFEPRVPGKVGVYVCGPTPYARAHAGHARANLSFDVLVRHLRARGFDVNYVRNLTDVDDKILAAAQASITGSAQWDLTSLANGSDGTTTA